MNWLRIAASRLRGMFGRSRSENELNTELNGHIDSLTEEKMRHGMNAEEASSAARREFGGIEQTKELYSEQRSLPFFEMLIQDVRFGARTLRKNPGFALTAVLTLSFGIGASTAVFSVVNGILLKALPYSEPERIVFPWRISPPGINLGYDEFPWGRFDFLEFARLTKTFQLLAAFKSDSFNLTGSGDPVFLEGLRASADFFPALGVTPIRGRVFSADEDQPGRGQVVLLSYSLWREKFSGDPEVIGRSLDLNGSPYTVIGVMPPGFAFPRANEMPGSFTFPKEAQLWVPLALERGPIHRGEPSELAIVGRLNPGVTAAQAKGELDAFAKHMEEVFPQAKGWFNCRVTPMAMQISGDLRRPLFLLLGAVTIVLLIACSNVANLLLTRALVRTREFTLRAALGARNSRLIRQLLTESMLLALVGGVLGILLAQIALYFVWIFGPSNIPRLREVTLDPRVFLWTLAATLLTGVFFGLLPALGISGANLFESLKEGGQRSGTSVAKSALRRVLLVSEVALALVLVISTGLMVRTFHHLLTVDGGFRADHVLTFEMSLPSTKYPDANRIAALYQKLLPQLQSLPGVKAAAVSETVPMGGSGESTVIRLPDRPPVPGGQRPYATYTVVSPGYFSAVGTSILRGREFLSSDTNEAQHVAIISRTMAEKYWPGQDPIGKQVQIPIEPAPMAIVGVAADVKHISLREETGPEMYVTYTQKPWPSMQTMQMALRTAADPNSVVGSVREAVRATDPDLPIAKLTSLTALVDDSLAPARFAMLLLGAFGALAVALAAIGMYGVISYTVAQRTQEIGIRMAMGASQREIFMMVLAQGSRIAGLGIAIGLLASFAVTRFMASFLFGVQPTDPLTYAAVSLLLISIALLACCIPARRAFRVDPLVALRYE
jgi:predicted permease